jgi:hypothetical protein
VWKNIVQPDRPQKKIWHIHIARWITEATYIHPKYVTLMLFHGINDYANALQS